MNQPPRRSATGITGWRKATASDLRTPAESSQNYGQTIPLQKHSVNLVILFAVLTCIPRNEDQRDLLREIRRALCPDGLLYISDLLLNDDPRNLKRYDRYAEEYGTFGIFELPDGAVVRHHQKEWIEELTTSFDQL